MQVNIATTVRTAAISPIATPLIVRMTPGFMKWTRTSGWSAAMRMRGERSGTVSKRDGMCPYDSTSLAERIGGWRGKRPAFPGGWLGLRAAFPGR